MKKIFCVDLDDTIALTGNSILKFAGQFNKEVLNNNNVFKNNGLYPNYWYFAEGYGWNDEETIKFLDQYYPKYLLDVELIAPSIVTNLEQISRKYEIYIITSRPEKKGKEVYNLTIDWIVKHNIKVDHLLINIKDKINVLSEINPDYYVDDSYENYILASQAGINSILFTSPYNYNLKSPEIKRANNWEEVTEILLY